MKKLANKHLSIVLCFLMMFTFVPVFGDSPPAAADMTDKAVIQNAATEDFTVESQHLWHHHWFKKSQPAPRGLDAIAPTSAENNDGKITGVNRAMEYKMLTEKKFKPVKGHVIKGLAAGTYQVRYKARPGYWPSPVVTGDVPPYVPTDEEPGVPIGLMGVAPTTAENNDGKITGTTTEMEYMMAGEEDWIPATEPEITGLTPGVYHVRCAATADQNAGDHIIITIPAYNAPNQEQDAPEGLMGVAPTSADNDDGKITGTTVAMEYMAENDEAWTPATEPAIEGLAAGMYHVRYAAKTGYNASEPAVVTVPAYNAPNQEQDAPEGLMGVAPTSMDNNDGKITGTTTAMEYMMEGEETWTPATEPAIEGLVPGMYHVRYAAKEGYNAGAHAMVTVPAYNDSNQEQDAPEGLVGVAPTTAANDDGKITGTTTAMEYQLHTDSAYTPVTGTEITDLEPGMYHVRYAAKEGYNASPHVMVTVPAYNDSNQEQDAPEGLAGVAPTSEENNDGKITGTTTAMEYMMEGEDTWTPATDTEITDLEPGMYHVRYAAKEGYNAGAHAMVEVPEFTENQEQEAPTGLMAVAPTTEENNDGQITGTTEDMEYMMEGDEAWTPATEPAIEGLVPGTYHVRYAAKEGYNAGAHATVEVPEFVANQQQEAPEGLEGIAPTSAENNDGQITGTTEAMEYMATSDSETWIPAADEVTTGLAAGTYHVRFAAKEGYDASPHTEVIVPEFEEDEEM